jgi:hypothetical protein
VQSISEIEDYIGHVDDFHVNQLNVNNTSSRESCNFLCPPNCNLTVRKSNKPFLESDSRISVFDNKPVQMSVEEPPLKSKKGIRSRVVDNKYALDNNECFDNNIPPPVPWLTDSHTKVFDKPNIVSVEEPESERAGNHVFVENKRADNGECFENNTLDKYHSNPKF